MRGSQDNGTEKFLKCAEGTVWCVAQWGYAVTKACNSDKTKSSPIAGELFWQKEKAEPFLKGSALVEHSGIEPLTSTLPVWRSPS